MKGMRILKSAGFAGSILKVTTIWMFVLGVLALLVLFSPCTFGKSQGSPARKKMPVIFDTDIGGDWDDMGALAVLHSLAGSGEAEILATMVSGGGHTATWGPACLDAVNTFYGRPDIPIGLVVPTENSVLVYLQGFTYNRRLSCNYDK